MLSGSGAEHGPHAGLHLVGEILHLAFRHQRVIRRDAGLAGIEQLAVGDALRGFREIGGAVDDGGRFAAEFERDRRQIAPGRFGDETADAGRAGEDQMIERQRREALRDLVLDAGDDHFGGVEFGRDHLFQQRGKPRHQFARLDHHPVARGDRAHRRRQRQLQRIIPGRDDADDAERLRDQPVFGRHELQRGGDAPRRHPFLQVLGGVLDFAEHEHRFREQGLDAAAMAEIRRDRRFETGLVVGDDRAQPRQPVETLLERRRGLRPRQVEQAVKGVIQGALARAFQWLVHGVFLDVSRAVLAVPGPVPWPESWAFTQGLARALSPGRFCAEKRDLGDFGRHKILKSRLAALSKAGLRWYIPLAPQGIRQGLPSQEASGRTSRAPRVGQRRFGTRFFDKARNGLSRGGAAR